MLVTVTVWLSLVVACLVISLTPGAGAINTMTNSLNEGWRRSIWGIVGQQLALVVHVAIVAAGVGLLVARVPWLFETIRYLGAAYLVYLGIRLIVARVPDVVEEPGLEALPVRLPAQRPGDHPHAGAEWRRPHGVGPQGHRLGAGPRSGGRVPGPAAHSGAAPIGSELQQTADPAPNPRRYRRTSVSVDQAHLSAAVVG